MFANKVLMIPPTDFAFNCQTSVDNSFQQRMALSPQEICSRALQEFVGVVTELRSCGVEVLILDSEPGDWQLPDAVFPNNWLTTDQQGRIYTFPMKTVNRQWEVRPQDVKVLLKQHGLMVSQLVNVAAWEDSQAQVLEGTGAMVFDHQHRIVYAALSERCHLPLLQQFCQSIGYQDHSFTTRSSQGNTIYHTNVMMAVGERFVVACLDSIITPDRESFIQQVTQTGKELLNISYQQMEHHYCGNILQLTNAQGEPILAMSQRAWEGFTETQQEFFAQHLQVCKWDITTIETIGGGSMRCMLAEIFNPEN